MLAPCAYAAGTAESGLPCAKIRALVFVLQGRLKLERELQVRRAEVAALQDAAALAGEARAAAASQLEVLKTQVREEVLWNFAFELALGEVWRLIC